MADEPVEKIGISEAASDTFVDMHFGFLKDILKNIVHILVIFGSISCF